jgi:hypothetical protein
MFGRKKKRQYAQLVAAIGRCPAPDLGEWARETMETLHQARGMNAAIHFAGLLVSGGTFTENMDACLAYLRHVMDDEGGGEA